MAKFKIIALAAVALICTVHSAEKDGAQEEKSPGGMELLKEDQKLIDTLKAKEKESGGNPVIAALIDLAEKMKELNNQRHQMHEATRQYKDAFDIFSKGVEKIIASVNQVLTAQADAAIDAAKTQEKNAKLKALLEDGEEGKEPPLKKQKTK